MAPRDHTSQADPAVSEAISSSISSGALYNQNYIGMSWCTAMLRLATICMLQIVCCTEYGTYVAHEAKLVSTMRDDASS